MLILILIPQLAVAAAAPAAAKDPVNKIREARPAAAAAAARSLLVPAYVEDSTDRRAAADKVGQGEEKKQVSFEDSERVRHCHCWNGRSLSRNL